MSLGENPNIGDVRSKFLEKVDRFKEVLGESLTVALEWFKDVIKELTPDMNEEGRRVVSVAILTELDEKGIDTKALIEKLHIKQDNSPVRQNPLA